MAISRERLEELINEGAFIFYIYNEKSIGIIQLDKSYGISVDKYNEINKCKPVFYRKGNVYQDICDADKIFETKAQAEWYIKYHATRTEELDLPMWKEFITDDKYKYHYGLSFFDFDNYRLIACIPTEDDNTEFIGIDVDGNTELYHWDEATEENYTKACDLCIKLFKGEEK